MKISKSRLKQIIKEELRSVLTELHDEEPGYTMRTASGEHVPYPTDIPEGLPADLMLKLQQLAVADPAHASELAASLIQDYEKLEEISDYLYDFAIAELTKNSRVSVIIDDGDTGFGPAKIHIYEEEDGEMYFAGNFPRTAPRSEVYESIQELINNPLT